MRLVCFQLETDFDQVVVLTGQVNTCLQSGLEIIIILSKHANKKEGASVCTSFWAELYCNFDRGLNRKRHICGMCGRDAPVATSRLD